MNGSIVILSGSHLCHNPRVLKEATALAKAGYEVVALGSWHNPLFKRRDQTLLEDAPFDYVPVFDVTASGSYRLQLRIRSKLGALAHQFARINNKWQLGYAYSDLRRAALRRKADLYIAHSEPAMAVAAELLTAGRRVGVDMEDWFSEDLLPEDRRGRPLRLLRSFECMLLTQGAFATCPSHAMSQALSEEFSCPPPTVIYNAFPASDLSSIDGAKRDRGSSNIPSIHWFSQTLGSGRGLEDLLAALPLVRSAVEIHLRGSPAPGFESWLWQRTPADWRDRIFLHDLVSNNELLSRIAEHDIGFAGEMVHPRSRDLTITNKILSYLLGGLAVIASDTAGQREVAGRAPEAIFLYPSGNETALAARIDSLLSSQQRLKLAKTSALNAAQKFFCWEIQEKVLLEMVSRALRKPIQLHKRHEQDD